MRLDGKDKTRWRRRDSGRKEETGREIQDWTEKTRLEGEDETVAEKERLDGKDKTGRRR